MALKNAYSKIPINRIFERISQALAKHGAKQILYDYGDDGKINGIAFTVQLSGRILPIKLPVRSREVGQVLRNDGFRYDDEQVYRVAWRNILDWVEAQMAMIDIGMVKLEEIFLPYISMGKHTLYEHIKENPNYLLPSGKD